MTRLPLFAAAGLAALVFSAAASYAQETPAPPAQQPPLSPEIAAAAAKDEPPEPPSWIKQCADQKESGKTLCQTARDLRGPNGQVLASLAVSEEKGSGKRKLSIAVPPGLQIQPGIRVFVDEQNTANARYTICYPAACVVEADATDAVVGAMKKGKVLIIQAITIEGKGATFPVSLPGFGKAFDDEPMPNDQFAKIQKDWADKMNAWLVAHPPKRQAAQPQQ